MNNLNTFKALTIASILFVAGCDSGGSGAGQSTSADGNTPNVNTPNTNRPNPNCKAFILDSMPSYRLIAPKINYNTQSIDETWLANEIAAQQKAGYTFVFEYNDMLNGGLALPLDQNPLLFAKMSNAITLNQTEAVFVKPKTLEDAVYFINTKQTDGTLGFYEQTNLDDLTEAVNFLRVDTYCSALVSELSRVDTIRNANNEIDPKLSIQALNDKLNELGTKGQILIGTVNRSIKESDFNYLQNPVTQYQFTTTKPKNGAVARYEYQVINKPYAQADYMAQLNDLGAKGYFPVDDISIFSSYHSDDVKQTTSVYTIYLKSTLQTNAKFSFKEDRTTYTSPDELYNLFTKYGSENYTPLDFFYNGKQRGWIFVKAEGCQDPAFCILHLSTPSY